MISEIYLLAEAGLLVPLFPLERNVSVLREIATEPKERLSFDSSQPELSKIGEDVISYGLR